MKAIAHKLGAISLAVLLLFSTMSFTLDMHFCGETLVDVGLYHPAEDCGMSMGGDAADAMDCCSDLEVCVQGQDDLNPTLETGMEAPMLFIGDLLYTYVVVLVEDLPENFIPFREYSPPRLFRDISVRDQSFLI